MSETHEKSTGDPPVIVTVEDLLTWVKRWLSELAKFEAAINGPAGYTREEADELRDRRARENALSQTSQYLDHLERLAETGSDLESNPFELIDPADTEEGAAVFFTQQDQQVRCKQIARLARKQAERFSFDGLWDQHCDGIGETDLDWERGIYVDSLPGRIRAYLQALGRACEDRVHGGSQDSGDPRSLGDDSLKSPPPEELKPKYEAAYRSYEYAEQKVGRSLSDKEAYAVLKEDGPADYELPDKFGTWQRHVGFGRNYYDTSKYAPRGGRGGRSIIRQAEMDGNRQN